MRSRHLQIAGLLVFLCCGSAKATTYTAATNSQADVQTAINLTSAAGGDTVQIPCSGTQTVTWTGTLTSSNNFSLIALGATPNTGTGTRGAGTNCLTIRDNNLTPGPLFDFRPTYQSGMTIQIQNMNIDPFSSIAQLFSPISMAGTCTVSSCPSLRITNVIFGNAVQWTESGNGTAADTMMRLDNMFGVIDHCTWPVGSDGVFVNTGFSSYLAVGAHGDNSWATADSFGGANNLFLENNIVGTDRSVTDNEFPPSGGDEGGARIVGRYNTINAASGFFVAFTYHGLDTSGRPRGGRSIEAYNNTINCVGTGPSAGSGCGGGVSGLRSGTGLTFGNTLNANFSATGGFYNTIADFLVLRAVDPQTPFGPCGGLSALDVWDTIDNTVYFSGTATASGGLTMTDGSKSFGNLIPNGAPYSLYDVTQNFVSEIASNTATSITILPTQHGGWSGITNGDTYQVIRATVCVDQGGRGAGGLVSGSTPSPASAISEVLDPTYEWDDVANNLNHGTFSSNTLRTIPNRDWYTDAWPNDNNGGGGNLSAPLAQTSSTVPFNGSGTCNASSAGGATSYVCGVGFGTFARRPVSPSLTGVGYFATDIGAQGTLYTWNGSSWTTYYTPYTYPHPLDGGTPTAGTPSCAPGTGTYTTTTGTITCSVGGGAGVICYSISTTPATNGTSGCTTGTLYTTTLSFSSTTTLTLIAGGTGFLDGSTVQYVYTVNAGATTPSGLSGGVRLSGGATIR